MKFYVKGKLIEGVTQVEMLKSGVVSVQTISRDDEGKHLTDEASLLIDINHYPIKDVRFGEDMVTEHHMGATNPMKTCNDAPVGYTDHPPVGEWQGWNGGVCPVHPLTFLEYVMIKRDGVHLDTADQLVWEKQGDDWDIIAYRIVEEYKAPEPEKSAREVWMKQWKMVTFNSSGLFFSGDPKTEHHEWGVCSSECDGATLFREVLQ